MLEYTQDEGNIPGIGKTTEPLRHAESQNQAFRKSLSKREERPESSF